MMSAYVFIKIAATPEWKDMDELHHALHAIQGVGSVHFLAGPTDVLVFIEAMDQKSLMEPLGKIRSLKGVESTDTRIVWPI
jgi:DNA-binding Lrp family transcriptional regulator